MKLVVFTVFMLSGVAIYFTPWYAVMSFLCLILLGLIEVLEFKKARPQEDGLNERLDRIEVDISSLNNRISARMR